MSELAELKKLVKDKGLTVGTASTLKKLRSNKVKKIWLTSNVPEPIKTEIMKYSKLNKIQVVKLRIPNDEFGVLCKKQFSVSVASTGE